MFYLANFSSYAWSLIVTDYVWQADEPQELIAADVLDSILGADDTSEAVADWIDDAAQTLKEALQAEATDPIDLPAEVPVQIPKAPVVTANPPRGRWVVAGYHLSTSLNVMADPSAERMAAQDDPESAHLRLRDRLPRDRLLTASRSAEGLGNGSLA